MMFQEISAGAISPQMPSAKAIVINIGETKSITATLKELYSPQDYVVYIANTTLSKLKQVLQRCSEAGLPAIVNCGTTLPEPQHWHPQESYSAALVAPGSSSNGGRNNLENITEDPFAHSFSFIGYQGYRCNPQTLHKLQCRYFEDMRLGVLRSNLTLCEPLLRNSQYAFIDMRSVRYSDYPISDDANPNGLYAEEICTVARYMGLSQSLKNIFIFGENDGEKALTICNRLISEVIWHICEGIASNIIESPVDQEFDDHFQRKIVSMGENGENITFTVSSTTQRWWMEVPSKEGRNVYIPCSCNDYQCACSGEIPLRWLFFYQKYAL